MSSRGARTGGRGGNRTKGRGGRGGNRNQQADDAAFNALIGGGMIKQSKKRGGRKGRGGNQAAAMPPVPPVEAKSDKSYSKEATAVRTSLSAVANAAGAAAQAAAEEFAAMCATVGVPTVIEADAIAMLQTMVVAGAAPAAAESGLFAATALVAKLGAAGATLLLPVTASAFTLAGHKKSGATRKAADVFLNAQVDALPAVAAPVFIKDYMCSGEEHALSQLAKWQTKVTALKILDGLAARAPLEVAACMPTLVPIVSEVMWDTKKQVKTQSIATMQKICESIDNIDIKPFLPSLIEAITDPSKVPDCIYALAGTTFVATVTASALSITVPVLDRGFKEKMVQHKRKCAVITENMAKLVARPAEVAPFMPILKPHLERGLNDISDPECRERFEKADAVLKKIDAAGKAGPAELTVAEVLAKLTELLTANNANKAGAAALGTPVAAAAVALCHLTVNFEAAAWAQLAPMLEGCFSLAGKDSAAKTAQQLFEFCADKVGQGESKAADADDGEDENVPDVCDVTFSLAYGSNILLNSARLHLKKGLKYGIIAAKSAGKTTMLRAIANYQVEGFPTAKEVRSIFIENDIQGAQLKMNVAEYVIDTIGFGLTPTMEEVKKELTVAGFDDVMCAGMITQLSGGWKMKLALVRATMQKADIMLMDEPTNHLDVINVQWTVDYLNSLPDVTCLIISHDTAFLDKTVSRIVEFKDLKLDTYKGNISDFVERFPRAKSYFELKSTNIVFKFPTPGTLDRGTRNKGRTLLEMKNVEFTYPGAAKPQISEISVRLSMASRVAIVGANGAGKSTLIKCLTGELKPQKGKVSMHPNCRFAYVAQHAFHHIEQHLEKTPTQYMLWRYETGEDKEAMRKATALISAAEQKVIDAPREMTIDSPDGTKKIKIKRVLERLVSRKKDKKGYMYEVKWVNCSMDLNTWFPAQTLEKWGCVKLVKELNQRLAAQEARMAKPLTTRNITAHYQDVGLEPEYANHNRMKDLSGGQKVKVVLAACTWACPHVIILDEPTNYLDRESLGALANAICAFEGGICLITHNKEFADATTKVTWVVANNKLDLKGDPEWEKYAAEQEVLVNEPDEYTDAYGNTCKIVKVVKIEDMTRKEIKKYKKQVKDKIKRGIELEYHEQEWCDEWEIEFD